ncbi:MAG: Cytochrome c oxidase subunit 6B [Vezdaea aestivalis]|nr:MAG: Cytochrome c oxidase subunit 6B [Vezdaea aestivalis]
MSDEDEKVTMPFNGYVSMTLTSNWIADSLFPPAATYDNIGFDARFPHQNQTKHCWQNYVDYHKCILAKGEEFKPCRQFWHAYRSLCPSSWTARWDDQRDNGTFPVDLE